MMTEAEASRSGTPIHAYITTIVDIALLHEQLCQDAPKCLRARTNLVFSRDNFGIAWITTGAELIRYQIEEEVVPEDVRTT